MATRECVVMVLDLLVRSKPGARLDDADAVIEAWCVVLEPLDDAVIQASALILSRQKGDFLPSAGTLFHIALDLLDKQPSASDAWALVEQYAGQIRAYQGDMVFNPPEPIKLPARVAEALQSMGGCQGWPEDRTFIKKEFVKLYGELSEQWRVGVSSGRLALPEGRRMIE